MKKILINLTKKKELRIALVKNKKLYDLNIENKKYKQKKLNIYKGIISKIQPGLEAVFVNYGEKKNGFLPIKEISKKYLKNNLYEGQELIVQINKEERNNKGAFLTTFITIIKNNLILMPNNPKLIGISKKITGKNRYKIKLIVKKLNLPKNMGIIIRTSSINKSLKSLKSDLKLSIKKWYKIQKIMNKKKKPCLIYKQNNLLIKILRDYLYENIDEILIDNYNVYKLVMKYIKKIDKIKFKNKINLYKKKIPLFNYFEIEKQIELIYKRIITLPSGGSIIIDNTEALTSIDINSSKYTKGLNIEITALKTNLEASEEIIRQLRLRNIGGLIVIDFIDMMSIKNQKIVENNFKNIIKEDKAKIHIGYISKFGLLEMSRQRINNSFIKSNYYICPKCNGSGNIRNNKSILDSILKIIEEKSYKKNTKEIHVKVPINMGKYLLKNKKSNKYLIKNKKKKKIKIIIILDKNIKIPNYSILRIKKKNKYFNKKYLINKNFNKKKMFNNIKNRIFFF